MLYKRNKGQVTVYACGITAVCLILVIAVLQGVRIHEAKSRGYQAVLGAVHSLKGDYQPDLFRRYHIFAIDDTYYGRGEGYMEERAMDYLRTNLNSRQSLYAFDVVECAVVDRHYLVENDCADFKLQITDYMKEKLPVDAAKILFGEFGNGESGDNGYENEYSKEADVWPEIWSQSRERSAEGGTGIDLDRQVSDQELRELGMEGILKDRTEDSAPVTVEDLITYNQENHVLEDPRKSLSSLHSKGILYFVMPDKVSDLSTENVNLSNVPSANMHGSGWSYLIPNFTGISGIQNLTNYIKEDQELSSFRQNQIQENELYGIAYAFDSFQGIQNPLYQEDEEYHAFDYELEYILMGKASDAENVKAMANRLLCIRLIPNMIYAFTDKEMEMQAETVATIICVPIDMEALIEPLTYVFLACWGYAESIMDVKALFQGERVPVIKSDQTWQLSITNIAALAEQEVPQTTKAQGQGNMDSQDASLGLNYSEYMAIMLALMPNSNMKYYRMLDVMELNIQESVPEFEIEHGMDEFRLQTQLEEHGATWYLEGAGSYIQ